MTDIYVAKAYHELPDGDGVKRVEPGYFVVDRKDAYPPEAFAEAFPDVDVAELPVGVWVAAVPDAVEVEPVEATGDEAEPVEDVLDEEQETDPAAEDVQPVADQASDGTPAPRGKLKLAPTAEDQPQ